MSRDENWEETLHLGRAKERWLARWLGVEGNHVIPTADYDRAGAGAPVLHGPEGERNIVMPDFLAFRDGCPTWWEAKWKLEPTFHRRSATWEHGLSIRSLERYREIQSVTHQVVNIAFLTESSQDIRAASLDRLDEVENHRDHSSAMETGGMVFWRYFGIPVVGALVPPPGESRALPTRYDTQVSTNDRAAPGPASRSQRRNDCEECGAAGQWQDIMAPNFIGPLGLCVPCFRRRWQASDHSPRCACAVCFDARLRR